jgi:hypothetical protein
LEEEASLPESAWGDGITSRLMTFFGSAEEEGFGGISSSGVIGRGRRGLEFLLLGLLSAILLHDKRSMTLRELGNKLEKEPIGN